MAARVAVWVPGCAGCAGRAPSMVGGPRVDSVEGWRVRVRFPRRVRDLLMVEQSVGRLAREWNTCRFLMIVYTRLLFPEDTNTHRYINAVYRSDSMLVSE